MVLESFFTPFHAEKHPLEVILVGMLYGTVALFLATWVFNEQASMVMVIFSVMATLPLFYHTMLFEERKDTVRKVTEWRLMREHSKAFTFITCLLIGLTIAFTFWYVVLPAETSQHIFRQQLNTINGINSGDASGEAVTDPFSSITGKAVENDYQFELLLQIISNNIKVMIFSLFFSLLFGSGAIFILSWNASVIAAAFGNFIRMYLAYFLIAGTNSGPAYFKVITLSVLRYSIHGIPEIMSYVVAGLAGGILSAAIIRRDFGYNKMERVMQDFFMLVLLAFLIVIISGFLEVYLTPHIFTLMQTNFLG